MNKLTAGIVMLMLIAMGVMWQNGLSARAADAQVAPLKVLLVAGGCCHEYDKQKDELKAGLEARANVEVTIAYDPTGTTQHMNPIYENDDWAKGYDVILHDECTSNVKDMTVVNRILKPHQEGLPAVALHCAMHSFRTEGWATKGKPSAWQELLGLQTTAHRRQIPIAVSFVDAEHPITKGMADWTTANEELYNNITGDVLPTAHALARGKQNNDDDVVAWTNVYKEKARVFATTLGHNTETVADGRYLDLVTRGLLWSCDKLDADGKPKAGYGPRAAK